MSSYVPNDSLVGTRDLDYVAVSETLSRVRTCSCNNVMKIEVEFDKDNNLVSIQCIDGCFLRKPHHLHAEPMPEFYVGQEPSMYLYCAGCRHRRSWYLFK